MDAGRKNEWKEDGKEGRENKENKENTKGGGIEEEDEEKEVAADGE
jgi:hypothetical protein